MHLDTCPFAQPEVCEPAAGYHNKRHTHLTQNVIDIVPKLQRYLPFVTQLAPPTYAQVTPVLRGYVEQLQTMRQAVVDNEDALTLLRNRVRALELSLENPVGSLRGGGGGGGGGGDEIPRAAGPSGVRVERETSDSADVVERERLQVQAWRPQACTAILNEGLAQHSDGITSLAHSAAFSRLFSGSHDRSIQVWDTSLAQPGAVGQLHGHRATVSSLAVCGFKLVSAAADASGIVWDVARMRHETKLLGHTGPIHGVVLMHDLCLTISQDKTVRVWDLREKACVQTIAVRARGQYGMAVHKSHALTLVSASGSKLQAWDLRRTAAAVLSPEHVADVSSAGFAEGNMGGVAGHLTLGHKLYTSGIERRGRRSQRGGCL